MQQLDLRANKLTALPEAISTFIKLHTLHLNANQLTSLPEWFSKLVQLHTLTLGANKLSGFPNIVRNLTGLKEFHIHQTALKTIPAWIRELKLLERLDIDQNLLTDLPDSVGELTKLLELDLENNKLANLPISLGQLSNLRELKLDENPLNTDLAAAYEQGTEATLQYLRAKAEAQVILNEAKLILIGEGEVGKSCLLGALRRDEWVEGRPTTHGIEIKPVIVTDPDSGTEITLNGWDFGGQRVYRPTHQLFFSAPAVYLVVWKPREGPQQGFVKEWITLIKNREPEAKVLVVATHGGPGQRQPDIDRQEILDRFGKDTVIDFFHVDSKPNQDMTDCTGLAELKEAIARIAASLPEMGRSVPAKWQQVRETLQTSDKAYLPYDDVIAICAKQGIDEEQAELFLRISHTGFILNLWMSINFQNKLF
ncbi:ADP-ribosylation factor-like protein [Nostoc sp.]|uniref:ADP-ribosylation factor-like protein n=1 Tax=Nostoc sp. TaxID=1180 RepID=UPI002FF871F3